MNPLLLSLVLSTPQVISVPQDHVLPVFGCGTGCRVETEQLALPERMPDGWWRVKVRQSTWIQRCDWDTTPLECVDELWEGRTPPIKDLWLFADCPGKRFASSKNPDRSDAWEQSVFHEEGAWKGTPKFQDQETVEEEENFRRDNRGESTNFGASPDFNAPDITPTTSTTEDEDDAMSYFARLAEE